MQATTYSTSHIVGNPFAAEDDVMDKAKRIAAIINLGIFPVWRLFKMNVSRRTSSLSFDEWLMMGKDTYVALNSSAASTLNVTELETLFEKTLRSSLTTKNATRLVISFLAGTREGVLMERTQTLKKGRAREYRPNKTWILSTDRFLLFRLDRPRRSHS